MPSEAAGLEDRPRRLHPVSPVFSIASVVRQFVVPFLLFVLFARGDAWQKWLILPFPFVLALELVRYFTLTYRLTAGELVIRSGLLARTERHIPFERIQNIELVETAVHRLLGVAEVRLQTGGGREVEAHLRVLSKEAVAELRAALAAARPGPVAAAGDESLLLRLPPTEIALHGLLTGRAVVLLGAMIGGLFEFNVDWQRFIGGVLPADLGRALADAAPAWARGEDGSHAAFAIDRSVRAALVWTAVFVPLLVVLRLAEALWTIVRLYDFTLTRTGDGLQSRYGLLTRLSATIPRARVQVLTVQEGVAYRWLRRASVSVATAGDFSEERGRLGSEWVAPIIRSSELGALVRELQPDAVLDPPSWTPAHPRAFTRLARLRVTWILAIAAAAALPLGPAVAAPAVVGAALSIWHARRVAARLGIALTPTSVVVRSGAFGHRRSIVRFARVQAVAFAQSPFDRRWGMASLTVDTAGRASEHRIAVPYIGEAAAREVYERLRTEVARAVRA